MFVLLKLSTGRSQFAPPRLLKFAAFSYTLLLTYLLLAPHPLWVFGRSGVQVEEAVDLTVSGFVQHVIAYALLMILVLAAHPARGTRSLFWCALAVAVHGLLSEAAQYFIPSRTCDAADMVANVAGAVLALLGAAAFHLLRGRRLNHAPC